MTRTVGRRQDPSLSFSATTENLRAGARFNEELQRLPTGRATGVPKGVYRFSDHADAEAHRLQCIARVMADQGSPAA